MTTGAKAVVATLVIVILMLAVWMYSITGNWVALIGTLILEAPVALFGVGVSKMSKRPPKYEDPE